MSRASRSVLSAALLCCLNLPGVPLHAQGRGQPLALPDGPGKDIVQAQCTKCHALGLIANAGGNTQQGWQDLFSTMVALPTDQRSQVAQYLAAHISVGSIRIPVR